jgi:hypothetical protein
MEDDNIQNAQRYARRAVDLYRKGDSVGAAKALGQALDLYPALANDPAAAKLAARITGLAPDAAMKLLADADKRSAFILKRGRGSSAGASSRSWLIAGVTVALLVLVVIGIGVIFYGNGINNVIDRLNSGGAVTERRTLISDPGREYYVVMPPGSIPENGWPTLVAVHGAGQTGADMARLFESAARDKGILLIAPTFAELQTAPNESNYENARNTILLILDEMQVAMFQSPRLSMHFLGQVYFGHSGGAAFVSWLAARGLEYAEVGFAMNMPLGVALANADSNLFPPSALSQNIPYLITVGETHPQTNISTTYADQLKSQGLNVELQVIPDAAQLLSPEQVNLTMNLVRQVYNR